MLVEVAEGAQFALKSAQNRLKVRFDANVANEIFALQIGK